MQRLACKKEILEVLKIKRTCDCLCVGGEFPCCVITMASVVYGLVHHASTTSNKSVQYFRHTPVVQLHTRYSDGAHHVMWSFDVDAGDTLSAACCTLLGGYVLLTILIGANRLGFPGTVPDLRSLSWRPGTGKESPGIRKKLLFRQCITWDKGQAEKVTGFSSAGSHARAETLHGTALVA